MTLNVDMFLTNIRTMVDRSPEDQLRTSITFERLVKYACDEGESYRTRKQNANIGLRPVLKTVGRNRRPVTFKEPSSSRDTAIYSPESEELYNVDEIVDKDFYHTRRRRKNFLRNRKPHEKDR